MWLKYADQSHEFCIFRLLLLLLFVLPETRLRELTNVYALFDYRNAERTSVNLLRFLDPDTRRLLVCAWRMSVTMH